MEKNGQTYAQYMQQEDLNRYVYFSTCSRELHICNVLPQGPSAPAELYCTGCSRPFIGHCLCFLRLFIGRAWVCAITCLHLNKSSGFELCFLFLCSTTWEACSDTSIFYRTVPSLPFHQENKGLICCHTETLCFVEKHRNNDSGMQEAWF